MRNGNTQIEKSPALAEVKLSYKCPTPLSSQRKVTSPSEAAGVLRQLWDEDHIQLKEEFVVLLLNNAKRCLGWMKVSSGGASSTIVEPSSIFQVALLANASSIILAHNHPSGNLKPSQSDKNLTNRIAEAGKMLRIPLNDHIILSADNYTSFRIEGLL